MKLLDILIVDDHKVVREGLKHILETQDKFKARVDETDSASGAEKRVSEKEYDIILMDINLGKDDGVRTTERLVSLVEDLKVLTLSMHTEEYRINDMIKAGAKGYVLKDCGAEELAQAIVTVAEGQNYFSNEVALTLMGFNKPEHHSYRKPVLNGTVNITKREIEVLNLIANELTNEEIAKKLNLSKRTIDSHRQKMLVKLGLRNTAGLVRFAMENNLIQD